MCVFCASQYNVISAQNNVGVCLLHGIGVDAAADRACQWFLKAAVAGHPNAAYNLARCYEFGYGVRPNAGVALMWYTEAADAGVEYAIRCVDVVGLFHCTFRLSF